MNVNEKYLYVTALLYNAQGKEMLLCSSSSSRALLSHFILPLIPLLISCGLRLLYVPPLLPFSHLFLLSSLEHFCFRQ